jgi:hypothetical protein
MPRGFSKGRADEFPAPCRSSWREEAKIPQRNLNGRLGLLRLLAKKYQSFLVSKTSGLTTFRIVLLLVN